GGGSTGGDHVVDRTLWPIVARQSPHQHTIEIDAQVTATERQAGRVVIHRRRVVGVDGSLLATELRGEKSAGSCGAGGRGERYSDEQNEQEPWHSLPRSVGRVH